MFPQMMIMVEGSRDYYVATLNWGAGGVLVKGRIPCPQESPPGFPVRMHCALCCQQSVFSS